MLNSRFSIPAFLALLLCLGLAAPAVRAQDWVGAERAQGEVTDQAGEPIAGASIALTFDLGAGGGPKPTTTNKKGRWSAIGLKPGPWTLEVHAEGYVPRKDPFTVFDTGTNQSIKTTLGEIPDEVKDARRRARANELLEEGNALILAGRYPEARGILEQVLELIPEAEQAPILAGIAGSYLTEGNTQEGEILLERALEIDPNDPTSLRLKIAALAAEGKDEEAQAYLARLPDEVELDPNAELNLGVQRYNDGDMDGAIAHFQRVRDAHPEIADAHYYCGLVYLGGGENAEALAAFREVLRLEPQHAKATEVSEFISFLEPAVGEPPASE